MLNFQSVRSLRRFTIGAFSKRPAYFNTYIIWCLSYEISTHILFAMSKALSHPSKPSKARVSKPHDDIYALHGKYIMEQYLIPRLQKEPWTWPTPPETKAVEEGVSKPVGILGAGVGGLYAAMMLQSLGIPYEILEGSKRTGGRVFTYEFSKMKHDYYVSFSICWSACTNPRVSLLPGRGCHEVPG